MLKARMLAGSAFVLALSCALPLTAVLKSRGMLDAATADASNASDAAQVRIDDVEYAIALSDGVSYTVGSPLDHASETGVVSLPKSKAPANDAESPSISLDDPIVRRTFEEEEARLAQEEQAQQKNLSEDDFEFDFSKTIFPVTAEELEMLKYVVQAEAGGGTMETKRIVTFSIVNRVLSDSFPDTLYRVLHAENQFPTIQNYYTKAKVPSESTCRAVEEVLMGACTDNSQNCLYFYCTACYVPPRTVEWFENDLVYLYTMGCDRFFTDPA